MREASEVMDLAKRTRGMFGFFALAGNAIQNGRAKVALQMLVAVGPERHRAWILIDSWERMIRMETTTGWTPEVTAMGLVMNDVPGWSKVQWSVLISQFADE